MKTYLVGGAVRDKLLKLPVNECDWVVVGATPQEMLDLGYTPVGKDFPVFLHPETKEEYALARTERKTSPGYKGFVFHATADVTLEEDLRRRDLTINAIAEDEDGTLIDPCGGVDDLQAGLLCHVSPAFAEDPVRILRTARLAARFDAFGFKVAHGTNSLMRKMVRDGEVDHLVPERVWAELLKALNTDSPQRFFTVLRGCGALAVLFPEIDREYADDNSSHGNNGAIAALATLEQASRVNRNPQVRFASVMWALGHDLGREQRLQQVRALCGRLRAPKDFTNLAVAAIQYEADITDNDPEKIIQLMEENGAFKQNSRWASLLETFEATGLITRKVREKIVALAERAANINAAQLAITGLSGRELGEAIREKRKTIIRDAGIT